MGAVIRTALAVAVLVVPGAFPAVLLFVALRSIRKAFLAARVNAVSGMPKPTDLFRGFFRELPAALSMRALVNEARAVAF